MSAPKLRFKEFNNKWKEYNLYEILNLLGGNAFSSKDTSKNGVKWLKIANVGFGKIKWDVTDYLPSNFLKKYQGYSLTTEDIVLTLTRPILNKELKIAQITNADLPALLNQRVAKLIINEKIVDKKFIFHLLRNRKTVLDIESSISGTDPPNLGNNELKKIQVFIPSKSESIKVASFFDGIDKKVQFQKEKVELLKEQKKGYMQKVFSRELKFKDNNGREYPEWSQHKLGNFSERVTRKNSDLITTRPLTISAQHGLIDQVEFFNKTVASKNLTGYYLLNKGEFAYNKSYSNGYPLGAIKRLEDYESGALSTLYICFTPKDNVNSDFLVHYFDSTQWYKEVSLICVEGARNHGLLNVSVSEFFDTLHYLPCLEEQLKIAKFFDCINQKIKLNEQTLKNLQDQKQAFMQQMFI
ncbi:restriction endonuclease subunit S [Bacillus sp. FJAT-49682]|uniref:Restriction endonuclease subunit S n=1 Tax=Lederbergia citrea TaxID=2833581 RepID=A0A942USA5_9BACI|nr:restriction endonuclease subunit S [Lederbergia citrea]